MSCTDLLGRAGDYCGDLSDCSDGLICSNGVCTCKDLGASCTAGDQCCSTVCDSTSHQCTCLQYVDLACSSQAQCCPGLQCSGGGYTCGIGGSGCVQNADCCSGFLCSLAKCVPM